MIYYDERDKYDNKIKDYKVFFILILLFCKYEFYFIRITLASENFMKLNILVQMIYSNF